MRPRTAVVGGLVVAIATLAAPAVSKVEPVATSLGTGSDHTCVIVFDAIRCGGDNEFGDLGNGSAMALQPNPDPDDVAGSRVFVSPIAVAGGRNHTCALVSGGDSALCWGWNAFGQLGTGDMKDQTVPTLVQGLSGRYRQVVTGASHTCALSATGTVSCWGLNEHGQVGNGRQGCDPSDYFSCRVAVPLAVAGLGHVEQISARGDFTCALTRGGEVLCWGANLQRDPRCDDAHQCDATKPVAVHGLGGNVKAVSAGETHACALISGGSVKCWGYDEFGELGDGRRGSAHAYHPDPETIITKGVAAVDAGWEDTCVITTKGGVACWGRNQYGEVGDGTTKMRDRPVAVQGLGNGSRVTEIAGGHLFTCARIEDFEVRCWGKNQFGALGDGSTTTRTRPVRTLFVGPGASFVVHEQGRDIDPGNDRFTLTEITGHGAVGLQEEPGKPGQTIPLVGGNGTLRVTRRVLHGHGVVDDEKVTLSVEAPPGSFYKAAVDSAALKLRVVVVHSSTPENDACPVDSRGVITLTDHHPKVGDVIGLRICDLRDAFTTTHTPKQGHTRVFVAIAT